MSSLAAPRAVSAAVLFLVVLVPAAASAHGGRCAVNVQSDGGTVRTGDVEVLPGEAARDVVALDGSVRLRKGAVADDVVAVGGDVLVDEGAVVHGSATAIGGRVRVAKGGHVEGSASALGGQVDAPRAAVGGERSAIRIDVNGEPLASRILDEVREALAESEAECDVRIEAGEDGDDGAPPR